MPNASTTQASSAVETTGSPIALAYGNVWVTGKRDAYYMLQDTGNDWMDYVRVGRWLLGEGEWDGPQELWINDELAWRGWNPAPHPSIGFSGQQWQNGLDNKWSLVFNFHSGCDAVIDSGFTPSSNGPDQGVDVLCAQFPSAIQPLHYSRIAYYMLMRKQPIAFPTNDHRNDPSQFTDINPIGLWRALKCRLFDEGGNMSGYAFTTNPAWHIVDVLLRRKLFWDYNLDAASGPDDLTDAIRARFNWSSIWNAAQYFDEFLANGSRRFEGNYVFASQTSLQAILEQMLLCSRSFMGEQAGEIYLNCDAPRASVFTFSRDHAMPGSFEADDQKIHTAPNRYVGTLRDILVPAIHGTIVSIVITGGRPVVTMSDPHPFNSKDWIAIGGTDSVYDGEWQVYSVPNVLNIGTPEEIDPTTFVLIPKGDNYPSSLGAGGLVGLLYSRFAIRHPEFWHKANMLARGAVGNGIARQRNKVREELDFASSTYDQVSRIVRYERDRQLGVDTTGSDGKIDSPYITPRFVKLRVPLFARDAAGNLAAAILPGDRVAIDETLNFQYAGDYEVLDRTVFPVTAADSQNGSLQRAPDAQSGEIEFTLGPYDESLMYDSSDQTAAGWLNVPGSEPGNSSNFTQIPLADGIFVFFTGILPSGSQFQLPSTGFPPANMFAWASPAGSNISGHSAHTIKLCDASSTRQLSLIYDDDEGHDWGGDVAYAAMAWLSADTPTTSGGLKWLEFTLLGGEEILWGAGILADGAIVVLPSAWASVPADQVFAVAYMHDQVNNGNIMFLAGARIDSGNVVHFDVSDDTGHTWHGNAIVLIFAFKNNMGTWATEILGGVNWAHCVLGDGSIFGVGLGKNIDDGTVIVLPATAGDGATLQPIVGSSNGAYESGSNHAQGIGVSYLDGDFIVHVEFNDGSGDHWPGRGDLFAVYSNSGTAAPTLVTVTPATATIAAGASQPFSATVTGNANHHVAWSVDGIPGGNLTVGIIDATGFYNAPNTSGEHTITATSVADPTASGSATVTVYGDVLTGDILTLDDGSPVTTDDGSSIDVS